MEEEKERIIEIIKSHKVPEHEGMSDLEIGHNQAVEDILSEI